MKLVKENNDKILENNKVSDKEAEEAFVKILTEKDYWKLLREL